MKYQAETIGSILSRINHDVFIPGIQRPYVWEPEQIIKLFDSLMRGYPINSFLFWELQPENFGDWDVYKFVQRFRQGNIHNDEATPGNDRPVPTKAVTTMQLDGQHAINANLDCENSPVSARAFSRC